MKIYKLLIMLLFGLLISRYGYSQTNPREVNENYMKTVFFEDFLGTQLIRDLWNVERPLSAVLVF